MAFLNTDKTRPAGELHAGATFCAHRNVNGHGALGAWRAAAGVHGAQLLPDVVRISAAVRGQRLGKALRGVLALKDAALVVPRGGGVDLLVEPDAVPAAEVVVVGVGRAAGRLPDAAAGEGLGPLGGAWALELPWMPARRCSWAQMGRYVQETRRQPEHGGACGASNPQRTCHTAGCAQHCTLCELGAGQTLEKDAAVYPGSYLPAFCS